LSGNENILSRGQIIVIINEYELPIDLNEFFAPLGNKENLTFSDFCSLFRSRTPDNALFFKTFSSSFHNSKTVVESGDLFPVQVVPK
jgi:hypothetical protein